MLNLTLDAFATARTTGLAFGIAGPGRGIGIELAFDRDNRRGRITVSTTKGNGVRVAKFAPRCMAVRCAHKHHALCLSPGRSLALSFSDSGV